MYPSSAAQLASLLLNFPESSWRPQVVAFLQEPVSSGGALEVLGLIGKKRMPCWSPLILSA